MATGDELEEALTAYLDHHEAEPPLVVQLYDGTYRTWPGNVEVVPGMGAPWPAWAERFVTVTYTHDAYREDRTPDHLRCPKAS